MTIEDKIANIINKLEEAVDDSNWSQVDTCLDELNELYIKLTSDDFYSDFEGDSF